MSLNSWKWNIERNSILDFVPVLRDKEILMLIPLPPEVDPGLFFRPFTDELWRGIGKYSSDPNNSVVMTIYFGIWNFFQIFLLNKTSQIN